MNKSTFFFSVLFLIFNTFSLSAQNIQEAFDREDYNTVVSLEGKSSNFSRDELYMLGYAFFYLDSNQKAITYFGKSIEKGLDFDYVYFYRGVAFRSLEKHAQAIGDFRMAVLKNPYSQVNVAELGRTFVYTNEVDSALYYVKKAREMPFENSSAYLLVPQIYMLKKDFKTATEEYDRSLELAQSDTATCVDLLLDKGDMYYYDLDDTLNSVKHYESAVNAFPSVSILKVKLVKVYFKAQRFEDGNRILAQLKQLYKDNQLPESMMERGRIVVDEGKWKDRQVIYLAYLKDASETLDITYMAQLLDESGETVTYWVMTERTLQLSDKSPKHLLCSREANGTHHTFLYGWTTDEIPFDTFKNQVQKVLNDEIHAGASSSGSTVYMDMGGKSSKSKRKKRKG